jgi:hypothetical protein
VSLVGFRVSRLLNQSRIRLSRRSPAAEDLERGDRVQIGEAVWRVRGGLYLRSGSWAFLVESVEEIPGAPRTARLLIPVGSTEGAARDWTLLRGGERSRVPVECVVVFPSG